VRETPGSGTSVHLPGVLFFWIKHLADNSSILLDVNSNENSRHRDQEQSAYNGYFEQAFRRALFGTRQTACDEAATEDEPDGTPDA
jgi:hypothetical protein